MREKSKRLFRQAVRHIPGGVNSPVRAYKAVGGQPVFIERGKGAWLWDADGNRYIDYVASYGPMILGHAHEQVTAAVEAAAGKGLSFGAPTAAEVELADKVCELMPSIEKIRMVNSGTEATMSAIRLARGYTGKNKLVKFAGCYHGHSDGLLVKAGSGALTLGVPTSPGVPVGVTEHTLVLPYNDISSVQACFADHDDDIAAVIVEPIAGNMNCVPPVNGFLEGLRDLCTKNSVLLIFDEVMTGFRAGLQGAQGVYGINPDLTTLGKVIGGGMPVGAFGGRSEIMDYIAPDGPVYQAGTLSGNPVAMAAGLATLKLVSADGFFQSLEQKVATLCEGLQSMAARHDIALLTQSVGSMFGLFFTEAEKVSHFSQVEACDVSRFSRFFQSMLDRGVFLAPSAFETAFMSAAHEDSDLQQTIDAAEASFAAL